MAYPMAYPMAHSMAHWWSIFLKTRLSNAVDLCKQRASSICHTYDSLPFSSRCFARIFQADSWPWQKRLRFKFASISEDLGQWPNEPWNSSPTIYFLFFHVSIIHRHNALFMRYSSNEMKHFSLKFCCFKLSWILPSVWKRKVSLMN